MVPNEFMALLLFYIGHVSVPEVDLHFKEKQDYIARFMHGSNNCEVKCNSIDDGCNFTTVAVKCICQLVVETGLNKVGFPFYAEGENLIK